uniref:Tetratricopeptide repeat protein n=2 Tax=Panagrolaimus superbus TaxID=310955 RepID=A0A914ZB19_9BILA
MENDVVAFNTASGNAVVIERRFKLLIVDVWNLTQQWDSLNNESCETLNRLTNNRMYLTFQNDITSLKQEEVVRGAEKLSVALIRFEDFYKKFQKAQSTIPSLRQIATGDLRVKVDELYDLFPSLVKMYEKELGFKKASLIDIGSNDNSDLFSALLSSWNLSLFIDKSVEQIVLELSAYPPVREVLEVLEEENVPLAFWPDVALGYYRLELYDDFVYFLEKAEKKKTDQTKDQMRCMDLLAAYYVKKGRSFRNEKERKELFGKATVLYTTADKLMMYDPSHLIGRAYFCLLEAVKSGQAKAQFDYVINYRPSDTSAIIGRALENYASGEYTAALAFFRKALKMKPDLPAEVRLGFGHCYLKLKNYEKAKAAFNRVIVLDPSNLSARAALAVCLFHEGDDIAEKALVACHNVDEFNPVILNQLANIYFLNNQIEKAEETAWLAYNNAVQKELKAESCYMIARCHHHKREYEKAFRYYYQATQFGSQKFVLPYYGLGQIHLGRAEFEQAVECFEKVLKEYPEDYETLKVLGSIYTRWQGPIEDDKIREAQRKGEELLRKVHELNPEDVEVIFELAQLQESTKPAEALKRYEKACIMLEAIEDFEVPCEVYSNIGALHFQLGHYEEAKAYYEKAEELLQPKNGSLLFDENEAKLTAVQYNLGRLYETLSRIEIAEELYTEILNRKPNHMDSIIRLGCIWRERGHSTKALEYYNKAISADEDCDIPYLFIANLHISLNDTKNAQTTFETVLKLKDQKDNVYALIGLGNVWLEALYSVKHGDKDEKVCFLSLS